MTLYYIPEEGFLEFDLACIKSAGALFLTDGGFGSFRVEKNWARKLVQFFLLQAMVSR